MGPAADAIYTPSVPGSPVPTFTSRKNTGTDGWPKNSWRDSSKWTQLVAVDACSLLAQRKRRDGKSFF